MQLRDQIHQKQRNRASCDSVTWFDVIRFCNALSLQELNLTPAYEIDVDDESEIRWSKASNGYRLLTS